MIGSGASCWSNQRLWDAVRLCLGVPSQRSLFPSVFEPRSSLPWDLLATILQRRSLLCRRQTWEKETAGPGLYDLRLEYRLTWGHLGPPPHLPCTTWVHWPACSVFCLSLFRSGFLSLATERIIADSLLLKMSSWGMQATGNLSKYGEFFCKLLKWLRKLFLC